MYYITHNLTFHVIFCSVSVTQAVFFYYNNNIRYICPFTCDINVSHLMYCILSNKSMFIWTKHFNALICVNDCFLTCMYYKNVNTANLPESIYHYRKRGRILYFSDSETLVWRVICMLGMFKYVFIIHTLMCGPLRED